MNTFVAIVAVTITRLLLQKNAHDARVKTIPAIPVHEHTQSQCRFVTIYTSLCTNDFAETS